jgi:hypothetical protein
MPRYVTVRKPQRPRGWYDWGADLGSTGQPLGQPNVYDRGPVDTGILDQNGNPIYRAPEPMGLHPKHEEE